MPRRLRPSAASDRGGGDGLRAIADGFAELTKDDHQGLGWEFPLYDALHAFCKLELAEGRKAA